MIKKTIIFMFVVIIFLVGCGSIGIVRTDKEVKQSEAIDEKHIDNSLIECSIDSDCDIGGCSSEICHKAGKRVLTACEYRPEYGCYKLTNCGCVDGKCSWRENDEFTACYNDKHGTREIIE